MMLVLEISKTISFLSTVKVRETHLKCVIGYIQPTSYK